MGFRVSLAICLVVALEASAWPCEIIVRGDNSHEALVRNAKVIVRAIAEREIPVSGPQGVFAVPTQVRFRVLAWYKGEPNSNTLEFNGRLFNGQPGAAGEPVVGYDFKRPRSSTPSCFNSGYVAGAEYLLLLGPDDGIYSRVGELTPYWLGQQPTNERITGDGDPWLVWVMRQLMMSLPN